MIVNETEIQERTYLQQVISILRKTIDSADISVKDHVDTLREYKEYLWSNKDIDPHEIRSMRESILNHFAIGESVINKRKRLGRMLDIPYFGRIDFKENAKGAIATAIYIGIHTFYDPFNKVNLIYDWRAPISGMYYDHELGQAFYTLPTGETVEGDISLKRQYKIRKGIMEYMIESSLTVHDDILQKELSSNADDKMRNIVATIQKEQNNIIRNEESSVLIIQGVAGSGKTSIALHRIAYLLYAHKDSISSKDILIISPNRVFADYISNVLPELGEETVPETSMEQILSGLIDNKYKFRTFFDQVGELLEKPSKAFIERIRYKATFEFISQLDKFILYVENHYFHPVDVKVTRYFTIPGEYIGEQFRRFHRYPMRQRFEIMTEYIAENMKTQYKVELSTAERNLLKKETKKMFSGNHDLQIYKDFYHWMGKPEMFKMQKNHTLEYADLAPLAYLHIALDGLKVQSKIKHLLIDEMQDYSPIQYKVIQKLYPCRKTILGDANQSVNPYGSSTADMICKALITGEVMKLCKSYRSTYEITEFAQKIRYNSDLEMVERHGDKPHIISYENQEEEVNGIKELVQRFRESGYKSLGIVCKNEQQAAQLYEKLKESNNNIYFLSSQSNAFIKGIIITSTHMAKGLEFDEVIVPHIDDSNYHSEIDRSILYVAVTRAMHRLYLTHHGQLTRLAEDRKL